MIRSILLTLLCSVFFSVQAQSFPELKVKLNESGSTYFKFTFLNQTWLRFNNSNPGTLVDGSAAPTTFDIGLRRTRMQGFGQLTDKVFVYTQFGMNNFNRVSARKQGAFFHDVTGEYHIAPQLHLGAGLSTWAGMSRFSTPSIGTILGMDTPLMAQATADISDQFLRKLMIYAKGNIGKLKYRVALADPLSVSQTSQPISPGAASSFAQRKANLQPQAYLQWQFWDEEKSVTPFNKGSWLGKKKVLTLGSGFVFQKDAMWRADANNDTIFNDLALFATDLYLDLPVGGDNGSAITAYAGYFNYDFGLNHLRMAGPMNPANGVDFSSVTATGVGNRTPMAGTGQAIYLQGGYKFANNLLGEKCGTLQPYMQCMIADYEALSENSILFNTGVNWLMEGHNSKLTLNYENRPVFDSDANGNLVEAMRKGALMLQYQISI